MYHRLIQAIIFVSLFFLPSIVSGNTYYVAKTGSDANAGTELKPFLTISRGLTSLAAGDVLYIKQGSYAEDLKSKTTYFPTGYSWDKPVTIAAFPGDTVVTKTWTFEYCDVKERQIQYVIVDGIIIDGIRSSQAVWIGPGAHHIRIKNSEMMNATNFGMIITTGYNEIIDSKIHHNGTRPELDHGVYLASSDNLITGNSIYANAGYGIHAYGSAKGTVNRNILSMNKIYDNGVLGGTSYGIILSSGDANMAFNNLIWNNSGGIMIGYRYPTNTKVFNNTIYSNRSYGIAHLADSVGTFIQNNIVFRNSAGIVNNGSASKISNNLLSDPLFVNASASDFHLTLDSPAIDSGVNLTEVAVDCDGLSRPQGAGTDIGAFEYGSGASSGESSGWIPQDQLSIVSATTDAKGAGAILDGNPNTRWLLRGSWPQEVVIYLGANHNVASVQYEEDWSYLQNYEIYVSPDGIQWGSPVAVGSIPQKGITDISFPPKSGSYLKLVYLSAYAKSYCYTSEINVYAQGGSSPVQTKPYSTGFIPQTELKIHYASSNPASAGSILDGNPNTRWLTDGNKWPQEVIINLGGMHDVIGLQYLEDWSHLANYAIYVSANASDWGNPVATGSITTRGETNITFPAKTGSFLKLVYLSSSAFSYCFTSEINILSRIY
jgi:parallel beta-helix repeat protein